MSKLRLEAEASMPREHTSSSKGATFPEKTTGPIGKLLPKVTVAVTAPKMAAGTSVSVKKPKPPTSAERIRNGM